MPNWLKKYDNVLAGVIVIAGLAYIGFSRSWFLAATLALWASAVHMIRQILVLIFRRSKLSYPNLVFSSVATAALTCYVYFFGELELIYIAWIYAGGYWIVMGFVMLFQKRPD